MTLVVDASAVIAFLVDTGSEGEWVRRRLGSEEVTAPHMLPAEVFNALRRHEAGGHIRSELTRLACNDLVDLPLLYYSFEPFADRVWELRPNVTSYDAWYVAIAEYLDAPLVTLDRSLAEAPGPRCTFESPHS